LKPPTAGAAARVWTLLDVLGPATKFLEDAGVENARFDAELLLGHILKLSRLDLYLQYERALSEEERGAFRGLLRERAKRIPLQLLLGETEFYSLPFKMRPGVFIPRPETELLVEHALARLATDYPRSGDERQCGPRVLELGVGSGVIAVSLAKRRGDLRIWASDGSSDALALSRANAERHGVADRITFEATQGLPRGDGEPAQLIVSNPPYIAESEREGLQPEVAEHDPPAALFAGKDGLDVYRSIGASAGSRLSLGGSLMLEIGADQGKAVTALLESAGLSAIEVIQDYAGHDRIVSARRD
jgi:release factor glutamine methyltransferase